jgi:hypothetical protein
VIETLLSYVNSSRARDVCELFKSISLIFIYYKDNKIMFKISLDIKMLLLHNDVLWISNSYIAM